MKSFKIIALLIAAKLNYTQAQNLQNGLQACYPFDCSTANMAATGSILDGTPFNVSCTSGVGGVANTAYAFSGSPTSYIELQNNALIKPTNAISFSGWVKFNNTTSPHVIVFAKNVCSSYFEGYELGAAVVGSSLRLQVAKSSSGCSPVTQHIVAGGTNLSAGVWYHVGFYAGTDSLKLFLNGAAEGTPIVSTTAFSYDATKVILGGTNQTFNQPLNGSMDNVRFYNRKLTNGEFNMIYTTMPACNVNGGPLLTDSLQACYPLDCNANNMALTGSALNGTPFNVTCTTDRFGSANSAYAFANSPTSYISLPNDARIRPSSRISFSGWVRFNSTTNGQTIVFTKNNCSVYFEGYTLGAAKIGANLRLQVVKSSAACSPGTQHLINGTTNLSANTWYHVGFYAGTDSIKMFLNGNPEGTPIVSTTAFSYDASTTVILGGTNSGIVNAPLDGRLDEIRFYNRKVYNYEFLKLYTSPPNCTSAGTGLLSGLQACYPLNCNTVNYAPTAATPPSLDGTPVNVACDTGHVNNLNGAYKFSGNANSYIELPNDPRIKPNAISFSCWSKIDVLNTYQYLVFAKNPCGIFFEGYALVAMNVGGGLIKYQVAKAPGTGPCSTGGAVLNSTGSYNPYIWHHVVFYMDGTVMKLYVDGAAAGTMASIMPLNYDVTKVYLGGTNQTYNYPLNGSIDNVRFYNRELSSTEVGGLYAYDPSCDASFWCGGNPSNCREAQPVGIQKAGAADNRIELYPNPTSGKLYISNAKDKSLMVYDINGRVVPHTISQVDDTTGELTLNASEGIYFVRIMDASGQSVQTSKIILTK